MSKIILFSNIKGGVGKTTLCAHFAEYLSMKGFPIVAVDADLQASLSRHREREMRDETIAVLGQLGTVTPRIKQSVVIKRYSTLYPLDKYQYAAVEHAFDRIIEIINQL